MTAAIVEVLIISHLSRAHRTASPLAQPVFKKPL
jgi:hypothetical protein